MITHTIHKKTNKYNFISMISIFIMIFFMLFQISDAIHFKVFIYLK